MSGYYAFEWILFRVFSMYYTIHPGPPHGQDNCNLEEQQGLGDLACLWARIREKYN